MKWTILLALALPGFTAASSVPTFWSDSYSAGDGICRCDSSYDHGIATTEWETPCGTKTVPQICAEIEQVYGLGPTGSRTYYNSVQCGLPPLNNQQDEQDCPGIPQSTSPTYTGPRCNETGPAWPLQGVCDALNPATLSCTESSWIGNAAAFLGLKKKCQSFDPTIPGWALAMFAAIVALDIRRRRNIVKPRI